MKKRILITCIVLILLVCLAKGMHVLPQRTYSDADFGIQTYNSENDEDQDGMDDQTDILSSAKAYVATKPKYKSKYYGTGYPDDGYGTCTDVVAFALKDAGYDLMALVYEDELKSPEAYDNETPDINIDFRRVKNLKVYFDRNVRSLTTDIYNIEEWQGGDIVVFEHHIGIVSDKRNKNGVTLVIHHSGIFQLSYEEDILEERKDITGHYRIG